MCYVSAVYSQYTASLVIQQTETFFMAVTRLEIIMCIEGASQIFSKINCILSNVL